MFKRLAVCAVLLGGAAQAEPLPIRNLNPLLSGYEIPPALPNHPVAQQLQIEFAVANISLDQHSVTESLQADAELQRWQLSATRPLGQWSLQVELPLLKLSGGGLDRFIENWHQTFSLPNGNRDKAPRNRLLIQHSKAGKIDYLQQASAQGLGDVSLRIGRSIGTRADLVWLSIKLPTGKNLLGSSATDFALSYATHQNLWTRLSTYQQVSVSRLGTGDRLSDEQKSWLWSGSLGMDARVTTHWFAAAQLDAHTKVFDSELRGLGNALQLSFGPRYESQRWQTSILISEDIAVDTAPDVQFQLDVRRKF